MNKTLTKILAFVGGLAVLGGAVIGGLQLWGSDSSKPSNWFKPSDSVDQTEGDPLSLDIGGAVISNGENGGVQLLSAELPVSAYAANGVSTQAESAYVLTATITPENANNKNLIWTCDFEDSDSKWASGKNLDEYVSFTSNGKTATFGCLKAFGEPIIIKVTSAANENIFATCRVDYAQRLSIGYVMLASIPLRSTTNVSFVLGESGGQGGAFFVNVGRSSVYTLASNYTVKITVTKAEFSVGGRTYYGVCGADISKESIYFDLRFFDRFQYSNSFYGSQGSVNVYFADQFRESPTSYEPTDAIGKVFMQLTLSIEDEYNSLSEVYNLVMQNYTIPVSSVDVDNSGIVI